MLERIPQSIYFDFKGFADPHTHLSYMMPDESHFAYMMRQINVRKHDKVIIYDKYRNISAPRTWFMLKQCYQMPYVWVLNGTFEKWAHEGRQIERGETEGAKRKLHQDSNNDFYFKLDRSQIRTFDQIHKIVLENMDGKSSNPLMLDGRLKKYFERANIPTSKSVPLDTVMDANYCFLPHEQLLDVFHNVGLKNPESDEVILTCQRGITASIVNLALKTLGNEHTSVYDGALEEYAEKTSMKITHE